MKIDLIKTWLTILAFMFCITTFAQNDSFIYKGKPIVLSNKMVQNYGLDYVQNLKLNNLDLLVYLNFFVDNSYTIEDVHEKANNADFSNINQLVKLEKSLAPNFSEANPSEFNVLGYDVQLKENQQIYKIGTGNTVLIIKSKQVFLKQYNTYRDTFLK